MNTMRVFLHDVAWREDPEGFYGRVDKYLGIADKHGIKTLFVIFDAVWHPNPHGGKQAAPVPGLHNSGWVQSPGRAYLESAEKQDELKPYVTGLMQHFGNDPRVLAWDLFNEPDNPNRQAYGRDGAKIELSEADKEKFATQLLAKTFAWAREAKPAQPVTSGVWIGDYLTQPTAPATAATGAVGHHHVSQLRRAGGFAEADRGLEEAGAPGAVHGIHGAREPLDVQGQSAGAQGASCGGVELGVGEREIECDLPVGFVGEAVHE